MKVNYFFIAVLLILPGWQNGFGQGKNPSTLSALTQGQLIDGFKVQSIYLNEREQPMGARFIHAKTGFILDLLQIESVPQAFIWVNTLPVSERGEPHTQEHMLITKGNKGHELNTREGMSLAQSSAFTQQLHTVYNFYTGAGPDVFYHLIDQFLDALLYPDYTPEEVKREVMNWGISLNPDKSLKLEEKGTVYNEMSTSMNNESFLLNGALNRVLYGTGHPLSYNAGGLPSGIRELTPKHIADYHSANYYLGNMGAITSLPKKMTISGVLQKMDGILTALDRKAARHIQAQTKLPPPEPAPAGEIRTVKIPLNDQQQSGTMMLAYPPDLNLSVKENLELSYFIETFAGNATTNLYKPLVDSKTHIPGFSAQSIYGSVSNNQGNPVSISLGGVKPENLTPEKAELVRSTVKAELERIASWPDHSAELLEFNKRYAITLASEEKGYDKFVNSPPQFGFRSTGDGWYSTLDLLKNEKEFRKSIVFKSEDNTIRAELASGVNIWKNLLTQYGLITKTPYVLMTKADPTIASKAEEEGRDRVNAEVARLKQTYQTNDDQQAIAQYQKAYEDNTAKLKQLEQGHHVPFIAHPPLTLDGELEYHQYPLGGKVPAVSSVFNNMSSATTGLALDLHDVKPDQLVYLAVLPQLLTWTGVIRNDQAVSYPDMLQQMQQQILGLTGSYSNNPATGRAELVLRGSGSTTEESVKAVSWMQEVLLHPNWTLDNLRRLQDLVALQWSAIRKTMQRPEETWVTDPFRACLAQNQPLQLSTASFLTRSFNIFRLKWMLADPGSELKPFNAFITALEDQKAVRAGLLTLLSSISSGKIDAGTEVGKAYQQLGASGKKLASEAGADLSQLLNDIPENSLEADWKMVCTTMRKSIEQGPEKTINDLSELRKLLVNKNNARVFIIGSETTTRQLNTAITNMLKFFDDRPVRKQTYRGEKVIETRLKERMKTNEDPVYLGLINPNSNTGVFINSVPLINYRDTGKRQLVQFLAAELYGGGGKESVFTKSTGAGLSYSTSVGASPAGGRFQYYAERTPELPQTLSFVIKEIKESPIDPLAVDYVTSLAIGNVRSAAAYESRGEAMANDLADGQTDQVVKKFRQAIVNLRKDPNLAKEVYQQKDAVYEKILPGYGKPETAKNGSIYFVIGPEKQMAAYEGYLKRVDGPDTHLYRLYPRDFWMP